MSRRYTLDSAYEQIGYGRMQTLITWTMAIIRNSGTFPVYTFAYMTLQQKFLCQSETDLSFSECSAEEICAARDAGTPLNYMADESYEFYMNNWYL